MNSVVSTSAFDLRKLPQNLLLSVLRKNDYAYWADGPSKEQFDANLLTLFRKLKLQVQWFCPDYICAPELLSLVNFKRFRITDTSIEDLDRWRIEQLETCEELTWKNLKHPISVNFQSIFSNLERMTIQTFCTPNKTDWMDFVNDVLTNKQIRGALKNLKIVHDGLNNVVIGNLGHNVVTGKEHLYGFDFLNGSNEVNKKLNFYKLQLGDQIAIVVDGQAYERFLEFFFMNDYNRKALLDICWNYITPNKPTSEEITSFLNAPSDWEAMESLRMSYIEIVKYSSVNGAKAIFKTKKMICF